MVGALVTSTSGECCVSLRLVVRVYFAAMLLARGVPRGGTSIFCWSRRHMVNHHSPVDLCLSHRRRPTLLLLLLLGHPSAAPPSSAAHSLLAGTTALSDASLVPALLPLLSHHNPAHLTLVASTVRILESFMDYK